MPAGGRIVVGVDGSPGSHAALDWALDEGRRREAVVEAVCVWSYPALTFVPGVVPKPTFAGDDLRAEAAAVLDRAVEAATGRDGPAVDRVVLEGRAAERLIGQARGADLLVVGRRGHGGFAGLLLGSVADRCAVHTPCPVVIVGGDRA